MNTRIRLLSMLVGVCLLFTMIVPTVYAAGTTNIALGVEETQVNVGDTFEVVITNSDLMAEGFGLFMTFDADLVECTSIKGLYEDDWVGLIVINSRGRETDMDPDYTDDVASTNSDGIYSFAYVPGNDTEIIGGVVATLEFTAKAEGNVTFTLEEQTSGTNSYKGVAATKVVTIVEESTSACTHPAGVKYENITETTHDEVCAVDGCGVTVNANIPHFDNNSDNKCDDCEYVMSTSDCSRDNPHVISLPYSEEVVCTYTENYDHYYKWTASEAGTLTIEMPNALWCDVYNDPWSAGFDEVEDGTLTVDVEANDVIWLNVYKVGAVNGTWTVSFAKLHVCAKDTLTPVTGQPATCEDDGWADYYQCSCGTYYADDAATVKIDDLDAWKTGDGFRGASGHVWNDTVKYTDNGDGTHTATYTCKNDANHTKTETDSHTYKANYVCDCQAVKQFNLTFDFNGGTENGKTSFTQSFAFGTSIEVSNLTILGACTREGYTLLGYTTVKDDASTLIENGYTMSDADTTIYALWKDNHTCGAAGTLTHVEAKPATCIATGIVEHYLCSCGKIYSDANAATQISEADTIAPIDSVNGHAWGEATCTDNGDGTHTASYVCANDASHTKSDAPENHTYVDNKCVCKVERFEGWTKIDDQWYYYNPETYAPVTGIARVPYPTELGYGPDQASINYAESEGESFIDKTTGLFVFDENGVFQSEKTGLTEYKGDTCYVQRGHIAWHPGLVKVNGELYYFIGDVADGGNKFADGEIYMVRPNGIAGFEEDGIYSFTNGKLSGLNGIVGGKYYQNSQLAIGAGLVKLDDGYIYVRSNGNIAVGEYWVTKTNGLLPARMFTFGEDGYLVTAKDPTVNGIVDGCYYKDGDPYYAGLIEIDGATYYVRSNGQLATGKYYITKTSEYTGDLDAKTGDKFIFGEDGKLIG